MDYKRDTVKNCVRPPARDLREPSPVDYNKRHPREWWNGRHARLRIWSRKGWRFKSSLAHHLVLHQLASPCDDGWLEARSLAEANKDGTETYFSARANDTFLREIRWFVPSFLTVADISGRPISESIFPNSSNVLTKTRAGSNHESSRLFKRRCLSCLTRVFSITNSSFD